MRYGNPARRQCVRQRHAGAAGRGRGRMLHPRAPRDGCRSGGGAAHLREDCDDRTFGNHGGRRVVRRIRRKRCVSRTSEPSNRASSWQEAQRQWRWPLREANVCAARNATTSASRISGGCHEERGRRQIGRAAHTVDTDWGSSGVSRKVWRHRRAVGSKKLFSLQPRVVQRTE